MNGQKNKKALISESFFRTRSRHRTGTFITEHGILSPARLPIPPSGQQLDFLIRKSEKRDSNPRPRPWQGRALPTELFSQCGCKFKTNFSLAKLFLKNFKRIFFLSLQAEF